MTELKKNGYITGTGQRFDGSEAYCLTEQGRILAQS